MNPNEFDVVIVGAGAAGLVAALEIALTGRSVAVVEAKDRTGGRILSHTDGAFPIELGAEFVHGNLPLTQRYLKKAGAEIYETKGDIWQYKEGRLQKQDDFITDYKTLIEKLRGLKEDKPVARFLEENLADDRFSELRFTLHNYVEGYYAADTEKASSVALYNELTKADDEQYRIKQGYGSMVRYLEEECRQHGVCFFLSQPVRQVHWKQDEAIAITEKEAFRAKRVLLTVPIGVLQKEGITFFPAIPYKNAIQKLGFGHVVKLVLQFENMFWTDNSITHGANLSKLSFLFSEEAIPTWWTHFPQNDAVLIGWLGGPRAKAAQLLGEDEVVQKGLSSLSQIVGIDVVRLRQKLQAAHWHNWSADPFSCGAYSYEVVGGNEAIGTVQQPIENTLFFAGEGLHPGQQIGTVEGALVSGRDTAHKVVASFS
ncbi:MAG: FAD-dependent oxidoreductase [Bacteroidota bacterium]|nr:FAD-dependent oxidoreductase [Bacteroidota bacterium]